MDAVDAPVGATRTLRLLGVIGAVAAALWLAMALWQHYAHLDDGPMGGAHTLNEIGFALAQAGYVALLIGVHRARPAGSGRVARFLTGLFATSWLLILAGLLINLLTDISEEENPLLPIGGLLQGVGALSVGIAVARRGGWSGWRRWWPLVLGLYYVGVLLAPAFAGYEPTVLTEAGWAMSYGILGVALATASSDARHPASTGTLVDA